MMLKACTFKLRKPGMCLFFFFANMQSWTRKVHTNVIMFVLHPALMSLPCPLLPPQLINHMREVVDLDSTTGVLQYPKDVNQLTRHLVCMQSARTMGKHRLFTLEETLALSHDLLLLYREGLNLGSTF